MRKVTKAVKGELLRLELAAAQIHTCFDYCSAQELSDERYMAISDYEDAARALNEATSALLDAFGVNGEYHNEKAPSKRKPTAAG